MATEKIKETVKKEKKGTVQILSETMNEGVGYLEKNLLQLFKDLLKINLLNIVILGLGGILSFLLSDSSSIAPVMIIAAIIIMIITLLLSAVISSVQINAVDERARGNAVRILSKVKENFAPVILYSILFYGIILIVFLPPVLIFLSGSTSLALLALGLLFFSLIISLLLFFLVQFGLWELVINKRGPVASLKRSYELITNGNIIKTLIFWICIIVVGLGFGIIFQVLYYLISPISTLFLMINGIIGTLIYVFLLAIINVVYSALVYTVILPFQYIFWKKLEEISG